MEFFTTINPVDWVILGILLAAFLLGWFRGIIRFLTGFLSFVVAIVIAGRYSDSLLAWLNDRWQVQAWFERMLAHRLQIPSEMAMPAQGPVPLPTAQNWMGVMPVPGMYREPLARQVAAWSTETPGMTAADYAVQQIAAGLTSAFAFVLLVVLLSIMISHLGRLVADQVHAIPLVGTVDRILGGTALLLEASLILSLALIWLVPTLTLYGAPGLGEAVDQARLPVYLMIFFESIRGLLLGGGIRLWNG